MSFEQMVQQARRALGQVTLPTDARHLTSAEEATVDDVFGYWSLPFKARIFITDMAGANGRAFTVPSAVFFALAGPVAGAAIASGAGPAGVGVGGIVGGALGHLNSTVSFAYFINVGPSHFNSPPENLLVHEMTHVWQGHHGLFSMNYVYGSLWDQALHGSGAYRLPPESELANMDWDDLGVEQQATLVERWNAEGRPESGVMWRILRDVLRDVPWVPGL